MAKKKRNEPKPAPENDAAKTDAPSENAPPQASEKAKPTWRSGLDFAGLIIAAVTIAFAIKGYIISPYVIPSGSMETTLHGRPDGGDRIFASKLSYRYRDPKRWEIAVFEFPYERVRANDVYGSNIGEQYKGQDFVKRIVGLPGEYLAIARGDIWVRQGESSSVYERLVKPDSVQRGMWLNVYASDLRVLDMDGLSLFWRAIGGKVTLSGNALRLSPEDGAVRLDYRPMVPVGWDRRQMVEMPGIPDRYTLEQPVQFKCNAQAAGGEMCGHVFMKTFRTQNMQARCPKCGSLQDETAAVFYHRRSGLPAVGRYAVDPLVAGQGEDTGPRGTEYHIVPDLRVTSNFSLANENASYAVTLREDRRFVQAVIHGDGVAEIRVNGETSRPEQRMTVNITPGKTHAVEFYMMDGTARLFIDSTDTPLLDIPVWKSDKRPPPRDLPQASGVSLSAAGGDVTIASLNIDRDVFYYSGWEHDRGEKFAQMNSQGEVLIPKGAFFPMGDHCVSSFDARSWGPVPTSLLRGPALVIWWPPERAGRVPAP